MAEIRIGEIRTDVTVIDSDALLQPAVMSKIVAAVEQRLADRAQQAAARRAETRIGGEM